MLNSKERKRKELWCCVRHAETDTTTNFCSFKVGFQKGMSMHVTLHYIKKHFHLYFHSLSYLKIDFMAFITLLKYTFELRCNIKISVFQRETIFPLDQLNTRYIYPIIFFSTFFFYYNERRLLSFYKELKFLYFLTITSNVYN